MMLGGEALNIERRATPLDTTSRQLSTPYVLGLGTDIGLRLVR